MQRILPIPGIFASASFILATGVWLSAAIRSSESSPATGFLGLPTRGGKLTIINCAFWALFAADKAFRLGIVDAMCDKSILPVIAIAFMALPLGWPLFLPITFLPDIGFAECETAVLLGLNAPAWGYGLSWILSVVGRWHRRHLLRQNICPTCGYDLRASFNRCPECGTPFSED